MLPSISLTHVPCSCFFACISSTLSCFVSTLPLHAYMLSISTKEIKGSVYFIKYFTLYILFIQQILSALTYLSLICLMLLTLCKYTTFFSNKKVVEYFLQQFFNIFWFLKKYDYLCNDFPLFNSST